MDAYIIDYLLGPALVPVIMAINSYTQVKNNQSTNLLYIIVTFSTTLSTLNSLASYHLNLKVRSRSRLTILTAIQLTIALVASIIGIHIFRLNSTSYRLPEAILNQSRLSSTQVFRYHFHADILPGFILFSQAQLCAIIKYELLAKAKRKFTFGEASIFAQLSSIVYVIWALTFYSKLSGAGPFSLSTTIDIVLNIGILMLVNLFTPSYMFLKGKATIQRYGLLGIWISMSYLVVSKIISTESESDPITWLVNYIFATHQRLSLFSLWISTVAACLSFSRSWSLMVGETNSLARKVFHLAVCVVFISGYRNDIEFTRFAASGMLIVFSLFEMIRAWALFPIGHPLETVCRSIRGKWDNRYLTLSHIYLLVGVFLPLCLQQINNDATSRLLASTGLISVGIGDSAAAIFGSLYGKTTIRPGSNKTYEGVLANITSMVVFKLIWVGYSNFVGEFSFIMAAICTAIAEALTPTCDNLVLPLVMTISIKIFSH